MKTKPLNLLKIGIPLIFLFLVIPYFFRAYPDYRFFWSVLAISAIAVLFTQYIIKKKKAYGFYILWLALSIVMSNGWFSYQKLTTTFPFLKKIPSTAMLCIGLGFIAITALCSGIYNLYRATVDTLPYPLEDIGTTTIPKTQTTASKPKTYSQKEPKSPTVLRESRTEAETTPQPLQPLKPIAIFGTMAIIIAMILLVGIIIYALAQNKETLKEWNGDELFNISNDLIGFAAAVFFAVCFLILIILLFLKAAQQILQGILQNNGKLTLENPWFIGTISLLLTLFFFAYFRKATIDDLTESLTGTTQIAGLLVGTTTLIFIILIYHTIYKILNSFIKKDGLLRKSATEIERLLVTTICELIKGIVKSISDAPNLYDTLCEAVKHSFTSLYNLLFKDEEDTL